jgi:hypothetical protein
MGELRRRIGFNTYRVRPANCLRSYVRQHRFRDHWTMWGGIRSWRFTLVVRFEQ